MLNATTYRPGMTADDFETATRHEMGRSRIYFFDLDTREELTDHPLNGAMWNGSGAMVSVGGRYVDGSMGKGHATVWIDDKPCRAAFDVDSFPGRRVAVKEWHGSGRVEWRFLASGDGSAPDGSKPRLPASTLSPTAKAA